MRSDPINTDGSVVPSCWVGAVVEYNPPPALAKVGVFEPSGVREDREYSVTSEGPSTRRGFRYKRLKGLFNVCVSSDMAECARDMRDGAPRRGVVAFATFCGLLMRRRRALNSFGGFKLKLSFIYGGVEDGPSSTPPYMKLVARSSESEKKGHPRPGAAPCRGCQEGTRCESNSLRTVLQNNFCIQTMTVQHTRCVVAFYLLWR